MTRPFAALLSVAVVCFVAADDPPSSQAGKKAGLQKGTEQLRPFNAMIGSWRGVGQLQRGSRKGAWTEKTQCEWEFSETGSAVVLRSKGGKQFESLTLKWDEKKKQLVLAQKIGDITREYRGKAPTKWPDRLQLESKSDTDNISWRCTIQQLTDIRTTLLFEKRTSPKGSYRRVAGVGYTRSGSRLAEVGGNRPKCVVTGGLGTIAVKYKGTTYYVCCQGCVQAFNDDPESIIAEYKATLKKK